MARWRRRTASKNGDSVEVLIGDDLVITGWVEALPLRYDAQTIMTGIVGRSKTADLIDCSASPAQHNGENLFLIASALARPFGVDVVDAGAPAAAVIEAQPEHGETVVDCLNRLLGQAQALAYDDERGRLVLGRPGSMKAATALVLGENILSCDTERSVRERFSSYLVTGQRLVRMTISARQPLLLSGRVLVMQASRGIVPTPFSSQELPQLTAANHAVNLKPVSVRRKRWKPPIPYRDGDREWRIVETESGRGGV